MTEDEANRGARRKWKLMAFVCCLLTALTVAALCMPRLTCVRLEARKINCAGNLKSLGLVLRMYSGDWGGHFPSELRLLISQGYLTAMSVYICPNSTTVKSPSAQEFNETVHCDYIYLGAGLTEDREGHAPSRTIIMHDRPGNHARFFNACFADGHVAGYTGPDFQTIVRRKKLVIPKPQHSKLERGDSGNGCSPP